MFSNDDMASLSALLKSRAPLSPQEKTPHIGSDNEVNDPSAHIIRDDDIFLKRHVGVREASVLVPLVEREDEYFVLLTKRGNHLPDHPGQVCFPGGSREPIDQDDIATALRETEEEVGIGAEFINIIGALIPYHTVTGFRVSPIVGIIRPEFSLEIDKNEVDTVFEVPLTYFLDRANHVKKSHKYKGEVRHFFAMTYNDYYIWGATAAMLVNLAHTLKAHVGDN